MKRIVRAAVSTLVMALVSMAHSEVVTFGSGGYVDSLGYSESGMTVVGPARTPRARIQNYQPYPTDGEREMLINSLEGDYTSVKFGLSSGGIFNLLSFAVEGTTSDDPGISVAFFNNFFVEGSNGRRLDFDAAILGVRDVASTFEDLSWFSFGCSTGNFCQAVIDEINFQPTGSGAPAPATIALLGIGLGTLVFARRNRA